MIRLVESIKGMWDKDEILRSRWEPEEWAAHCQWAFEHGFMFWSDRSGPICAGIARPVREFADEADPMEHDRAGRILVIDWLVGPRSGWSELWEKVKRRFGTGFKWVLWRRHKYGDAPSAVRFAHLDRRVSNG